MTLRTYSKCRTHNLHVFITDDDSETTAAERAELKEKVKWLYVLVFWLSVQWTGWLPVNYVIVGWNRRIRRMVSGADPWGGDWGDHPH